MNSVRNRLNSVVDVMGDFIGEALRNADLASEAVLNTAVIFLFSVQSDVHYPCHTDVCQRSNPHRVSANGGTEGVVGAGLLGGAGGRRCHLGLLGGLLHLEPLLLGELRLLLPRLQGDGRNQNGDSISYLGKQFLLLPEELFLWDPQVLQSRAGLPPLQSYRFTLLEDVFYLRDEGATAGQDSPLMTCSGEMVFLSDLLHISLASEEMRWMNSVQQLTTSSLASLATRTFGRVSLIILLMAALGMVRSSSFPEEEAIVASEKKQHTKKTDQEMKAPAPRRARKR
ncbi:hypothetical protein EYF80_054837 [Liparis tanakae]|uniref:Uncharacterized protein n=1 Tax=Liparis tanakae TaxID=230148 RepID=A0A4Z2F3C3_9TELE|nr:hypothetical protein EYF80_054837 [Liparis tanakae]